MPEIPERADRAGSVLAGAVHGVRDLGYLRRTGGCGRRWGGQRRIRPAALAEELRPLTAHVRVHVQACSAARNEGVREGVQWLVQDMAQRLYALDLK